MPSNTQHNTRNSQPHNNIIAVASGKGGVGKTWFSITLAQLFARSGRRVLLVDGDVGLANVDVQLGMNPPKDLSHIFTQNASFTDIATPYEAGGFDIIAGRSGSGEMANLPDNALELLAAELHDAAAAYDYVIVDLGAGIEKNVRTLASVASKLLVILTDEPTSLTDAYAFIKLCLQKSQQTNIQVVVNQAANRNEGEKVYQAIQKACKSFLNFDPKLLGIIRKDNKVRDAIRSQQSLITRSPSTTAATDVAALSVKLMQG